MEEQGEFRSHHGLENHGIVNANAVWWNPSTPALYEHAVQRREGLVAHRGPLVVRTGQYTGRSPNDKYIVREPGSEKDIWWDAAKPFEPEHYERLKARLTAYLQGRDLFVQDCYAGAHPDYQIPIRIVNTRAWHNLFARNMFIREHDPAKLANHVLRDGTSLIRIAGRIGTGDKYVGVLRRYIGDHKQACAAEVATIVRPLLELEDAEKERAKERADAKKKRTVKPAAAETQGKVVRVAFGR